MPKRTKDAVFDPAPMYGGGVYGEAKSLFKFQALIQDYQELQKEAFVTKNRLEEAKQRKLRLAAEVRFLRNRYNRLIEAKKMNSLREQRLVRSGKPHGRTKIMGKQKFSRKESHLHRLPPIPEQPEKKRRIMEEVTMPDPHTSHVNVNPHFDINQSRKANSRKERLSQNSLVLEFYLNDAAQRKSVMDFDLNKLSSSFSSSRVPVFDLNEISTGDEDFQGNAEAIKLEEAQKNLLHINDKDLKLSICRNSGEASSHTGKRRITWKDPVALRV